LSCTPALIKFILKTDIYYFIFPILLETISVTHLQNKSADFLSKSEINVLIRPHFNLCMIDSNSQSTTLE
jgi:hypothetical protein